MSQPTEAIAVRHGTCRLILAINDVHYIIRRGKGTKPGVKVWSLKAEDGPRPGARYAVIAHFGQVACTCPDSVRSGAVCKHVRAMQAAQLVNPRLVPQAEYVAATLAQEGGA